MLPCRNVNLFDYMVLLWTSKWMLYTMLHTYHIIVLKFKSIRLVPIILKKRVWISTETFTFIFTFSLKMGLSVTNCKSVSWHKHPQGVHTKPHLTQRTQVSWRWGRVWEHQVLTLLLTSGTLRHAATFLCLVKQICGMYVNDIKQHAVDYLETKA